LVDGARELRRALDAGVEVIEAFVCEPLLAGPDARAALERLRDSGASIHTTTETVFGRLAYGDREEGLVAVIRVPGTELGDREPPPEPLIVVLEGVEKPGNLGAILRSADGARADRLIVAAPRTDLLNPNAIRAGRATICLG